MDALQGFDSDGIVADTHIVKPSSVLKVQYGSIDLTPGLVLTPTQVKDPPNVSWAAEPDAFYLVLMMDLDVYSRAEPALREFDHWRVGNIPGSDVSKGEVLSGYIGAGPPVGTGFHRYVFLLFKQPGKLTFDEPRLSNRSGDGRANQQIIKFAEKYGLGNPIAGNYYQAEYDDYVPILRAQLA